MFITAERATRVAFSEPTFRVQPALLVAKGNPFNIKHASDLVTHPGRVAVLSGSVEQAWVQRMGVPSARIAVVPDALTGLRAVQGGIVASLVLSAPTLRWMARDAGGRGVEVLTFDGDAAPGTNAMGGGYGAFAFRPQDERLRDAWNTVLQTVVGQPEHLALVQPLGFSSSDMPGGVRLAELVHSAP